MVDLISQQNQLRGLTDEALQSEVKQPSGAVPGFLVLNELSRRQKMRSSYMAATARRSPSTVADDLLSPAAASAAPQGGLDALPGAPGPGSMPGLGGASEPGFASGGIVGFDPYTQFEQTLQDQQDQKDQLQKLALIEAGLGIAAGTSPNTLTNVGAGALPAVQGYATSMADLNKSRQAGLGELLNLQHYQNADDVSRQQLALDRDKLTAQLDPNSALNVPAAVRTEQYVSTLPVDQQDSARADLFPKYVTNTNSNDARVQNAYKMVYNGVLKELQTSGQVIDGTSPEDQQKITAAARERFKQLYPAWAQKFDDMSGGGTNDPSATAAPQTDPLGLGL